MVNTRAPSDPVPSLLSTLRGAAALSVQLLAGLMLILVAGMVALVTAVAGLTLAAVAIAMRLSANGKGATRHRATSPEGITLEARPTPRGWTVE